MGGGLFLMSEVPLYIGVPHRPSLAGRPPIQGYFAHKKPLPPRTLQ